MKDLIFPAEWTKNATIQLTWPHMETDWFVMIEDAKKCFINIATEILKRQNLIIVCQDKSLVEYELKSLKGKTKGKLLVYEVPTNDTWARDHAPITVFHQDVPYIYDFGFNGWGLKFASDKDNLINRRLLEQNVFNPNVKFKNQKDFILEGGSIESDGQGTILTTSQCLLSPNRNPWLSKKEIEEHFAQFFGTKRVLWLDYGFIDGDDTDSHIDTLARFCDERTIAYVQCTDKSDKHYEELQKMEVQLKTFRDNDGNPYQLIPLPFPSKIRDTDNHRLPATYANFLIMDDAVLLPTYLQPTVDAAAIEQLQKAFPTKEIVSIDCTALIYQHGSLHCVTMQYPAGVIKL